MTDSGVLVEPEHSRRPALTKLTTDLQELRGELLEGFGSRKAVLEWEQRLAVRTLGELPESWYEAVGRQFQGVSDSGAEQTLLSVLLVPEARERDLEESAARELRERLFALAIRPAYHRAFRQLRADAGEYLDDDDGTASQHTAARQRWIAMRPALDELETYQRQALASLVGDLEDPHDEGGLESPSAILDWGATLEQATHGELAREFVARCYREPSTAEMLTSDEPAQARARELFAAVHVLPRFNAGVGDLAGRTSETPDAERQEEDVQLA